MKIGWLLLVSVLWLGMPPPAQAQTDRGELLYQTHCIACHTKKVHWRDKKRASDWHSLKQQVQRWQALSELDWSEEEINDVANYLNKVYYHFPREGGNITSN